jgi:hypothetical protein
MCDGNLWDRCRIREVRWVFVAWRGCEEFVLNFVIWDLKYLKDLSGLYHYLNTASLHNKDIDCYLMG